MIAYNRWIEWKTNEVSILDYVGTYWDAIDNLISNRYYRDYKMRLSFPAEIQISTRIWIRLPRSSFWRPHQLEWHAFQPNIWIDSQEGATTHNRLRIKWLSANLWAESVHSALNRWDQNHRLQQWSYSKYTNGYRYKQFDYRLNSGVSGQPKGVANFWCKIIRFHFLSHWEAGR